MEKPQKFGRYISLILLLIFYPCILNSQPSGFSTADQRLKFRGKLDSLTEKCLKTFEVPGIAVAVIKDGHIVHSKGYGVSSLATKQKVDENTLFAIASNTKSFTSAAIGILVDEKKLNWDDKVIDYIPEFRLYTPYVTQEFTIRDLLTHRSGLGLGAGDLMFWPDSTDFTVNEIISNLRYLKAVSGFRTKYDYDNLLYVVAGEIVTRVSGMSWETFVQTRILTPLDMTESRTSLKMITDRSNIITPHASFNGSVQVIKRFNSEVINPAGGIYSNLTDMCKWITLMLNGGKYGEGNSKQLFSKEVHNEMWTPQTIMSMPCVREPKHGSYTTHFASYGLGWTLYDAQGYAVIKHGGGLPGMISDVIMVPELKLGIVILTNQQADGALNAIIKTILDYYFGFEEMDRVNQFYQQKLAEDAEAKKVSEEVWESVESQKNAGAGMSDLKLFTGIYVDKWFGQVVISESNGRLFFESKRSFRLKGEMLPYKNNTFIVRWNDRSLDADAFVIFESNEHGQAIAMKMNAVSPLTDFSFDFKDLEFQKQNLTEQN